MPRIKGERKQKEIQKKQIRVAAYCRVSTFFEEQDDSYITQKQYWEDYVKKNPEMVLVDTYADKASGTKDTRERFQDMIDDCKDGKIDLILTKSISRFARNTRDLLTYLDTLKKYGVEVYFENDHIDTREEGIRSITLTLLGAVAQMEVENTSKNVKWSLQKKMENKQYVGNPECYGYTWNPDTKKLTINEEEAKVVRWIFNTYERGEIGSDEIAKELTKKGVKTKKGKTTWQPSVILDIISNEKYIGDLKQQKTITIDPIDKTRVINRGDYDYYYDEGRHEAIISREQFERVNKMREERGKGRKGKAAKHNQFTGMIRCGFCGDTYYRRTAAKKVVWGCTAKNKGGKSSCPYSKNIPEKLIEEAFMDLYRRLVGNTSEIRQKAVEMLREMVETDDTEAKITERRKKLETIEERQRRLMDRLLDETITKDAYKAKNDEMQANKERLQEEILELEANARTTQTAAERIAEFESVLSDDIGGAFDRYVFEVLVDHVIIGEYDEEGNPDPYQITFVLKNGEKERARVDTKKKVFPAGEQHILRRWREYIELNSKIGEFWLNYKGYAFDNKDPMHIKKERVKQVKVVVRMKKEANH